MMATCPICGTLRVICWPEHWVYKRGETYYCSEDCMIVDQTKDMKLIKMIAHVRAMKGSKMIKKIGDEQKAQAVRIALGGGNPLPYLKQCGSKNPSASWAYIKSCLAKKDPETFAKIEAGQPAQAPVVKLSGPLKIETPEAAKVEVVETPEKKSGLIYKIRAIDTGIGSWEYSEKYNWIRFSAKDGEDGVTMTPAEWAQMLRDLPDVFRVLEVKRR